jgi:Sulfatase
MLQTTTLLALPDGLAQTVSIAISGPFFRPRLIPLSAVLLDPQMYIYYNATFQRKGESPKSYPGEYSTDLVSSKSVSFLQDAASAGKPFYLQVAPIGPHSETVTNPTGPPAFNPPVPAKRHQDRYKGVKVPRTANFNPEQVSIQIHTQSLIIYLLDMLGWRRQLLPQTRAAE